MTMLLVCSCTREYVEKQAAERTEEWFKWDVNYDYEAMCLWGQHSAAFDMSCVEMFSLHQGHKQGLPK